MTKLEEVAKAICCGGGPCQASGAAYDPIGGSISRCQSDTFLRDARAAIEAMRVPTKQMIENAMIQPHPSIAEAGGLIEQGHAGLLIDYQAMIDAILTEPTKE